MKQILKIVLLAGALFEPALAFSQDAALGAMLEKGPVVLVEETTGGAFSEATAVIEIDAPAERVWTTLLAMDAFHEFMPKVTTSEVKRGTDPNTFDVHFVYDIPGPDTDYVARMSVDPGKKEIRGTWLKDDLKGSSWDWRVDVTGPTRCLLFHKVSVKNFSPLLQQVEDDQQTVTVGVNVSTALATVKAIKRRVEAAFATSR